MVRGHFVHIHVKASHWFVSKWKCLQGWDKKNHTDSDRTDNDDVEVQTGTDQLSPLTRHRAIFNLRNMSVFTHSLRRNSATVTGSTWNKK